MQLGADHSVDQDEQKACQAQAKEEGHRQPVACRQSSVQEEQQQEEVSCNSLVYVLVHIQAVHSLLHSSISTSTCSCTLLSCTVVEGCASLQCVQKHRVGFGH